jgi:hypothetical protein
MFGSKCKRPHIRPICKFFADKNGKCIREETCRFLHEKPAEVEQKQVQKVAQVDMNANAGQAGGQAGADKDEIKAKVQVKVDPAKAKRQLIVDELLAQKLAKKEREEHDASIALARKLDQEEKAKRQGGQVQEEQVLDFVLPEFEDDDREQDRVQNREQDDDEELKLVIAISLITEKGASGEDKKHSVQEQKHEQQVSTVESTNWRSPQAPWCCLTKQNIGMKT